MKKTIAILCFMVLALPAQANESELACSQSIQNKVDNIGTTLLNANEINKRVVFAYSDFEAKKLVIADKTLTSRQVVIYSDEYKSIENDDELAAFLARYIVIATRSYNGLFGGALRSLQVKAAPKKFEIVADKMAVDYMVNAGYDPIALITFIHKTVPQKRYDLVSNHNLTSKRLAIIYEYIYTKYPYFLANNQYLANPHYQNFLLTSINNRKMLHEKIQSNSKERLKYE